MIIKLDCTLVSVSPKKYFVFSKNLRIHSKLNASLNTKRQPVDSQEINLRWAHKLRRLVDLTSQLIIMRFSHPFAVPMTKIHKFQLVCKAESARKRFNFVRKRRRKKGRRIFTGDICGIGRSCCLYLWLHSPSGRQRSNILVLIKSWVTEGVTFLPDMIDELSPRKCLLNKEITRYKINFLRYKKAHFYDDIETTMEKYNAGKKWCLRGR
jgi:hypothetical protein